MARSRFRSKTQSWGQTPRSKRVVVYLSAVLTAVVSSLYFIDFKLRPVIMVTAKAMAVRTATDALNQALTEEITRDAMKGGIVQVERTHRGDLQLATFDFAAVTHLQAAATARAQGELQSLEKETMSLPFSQVLGGSVFAAVGPSLPVRMLLVGAAHSSVVADIRTVGINQTVHLLYLDMTADVTVIAPLVTAPVTIHSRIPIAYVVLSGDVPGTYMGPSDRYSILPPSPPKQ